VDPALFLQDLEAKPAVLREWADSFGAPWADAGITADRRIVLLGMGSSHYANAIGAARLRTHGIDATAVLASSDLLPLVDPDDVVIAVSASGGSAETLAAVEHYADRARIIAMVNASGATPIGSAASLVVPMRAGVEAGGVACRSFQHTLALLLDLEGTVAPGLRPVPELLRASADASADLLDRQDAWLGEISELLLGPDGSSFVAPARRLSSAQQSALMLREGPRLPAIGCETGDWSHVDVYLTKTTDYRMLLFAGESRWEPQLLEWCVKRGSTVVGVGGRIAGARAILRYRHDSDDDVRLLSETLVAELIAADRWKE
jgi:glucosamine--fructose-6-phosphate aminotransferase (isomerizing)